MVEDRAALTMADRKDVVYDLLNDLEWPLTQISRICHYLMFNISETIQNRHMVTEGIFKVISAMLPENKCSLVIESPLQATYEGWRCQYAWATFEGCFSYCKWFHCLYLTSSSAVAKRPRDASCLSVVIFNSTKRRTESFIVSYIRHRFITACN